MKIAFDSAKRDLTLKNRGLDFADAAVMFEGETLTIEDDRFDYGETRFITFAAAEKRMVAIVWTPRGAARHIISMRFCHEKEARKVRAQMG